MKLNMKFSDLKCGDMLRILVNPGVTFDAEFYSFSDSYNKFCLVLSLITFNDHYNKKFPANLHCKYRQNQHNLYECVWWEIEGCSLN